MRPDSSFAFDPTVAAALIVAAVVYVRRWRRVRAGDGARGAGVPRLVSFCAGLATVAAALMSPLDRLADQLFFVHMAQHVLVLDIAPILLIAGLTKQILRPATRRLTGIERSLGPFGHPVFAIVLYVGGVWTWHIPALYDAALRNAAVHAFEHGVYLTVGGVYWWHLLAPIRSRLRLGGMGPAVYMAATKLLVGLLGISLAFAPGRLYAFYSHSYWGLSPHDDQALAGMTMALEQSLVMGVALASIFIRMLGESEREAQRAERLAER